MAINQKNRGFTLLVALIFMSVMLAFGLSLGSLAYKQQVLASDATASQYAFYAADAALECALYADQQNNGLGSLFAYGGNDGTPKTMICDNAAVSITQAQSGLPNKLVSETPTNARISLDNGTRCAEVKIYKYETPLPSGITTFIFSQGYNVSCTKVGVAGQRVVARGIIVHY